MAVALEEKKPDTFELSPREIAIAQGEDPDAAVEKAVEAEEDGGQEAQVDDAVEDGGAAEHDAVNTGGVKEDASATSWIDDEVKSLAKSHGLTEDDLGAFTSAEQLRRFSTLVDKHIVSPPSETDSDTASPAEKDGDAVPELDVQKYVDEGYGEETIALVKFAKGLKQELDSIKPQISQIAEHRVQEEATRRINEFHDAVDAMDEKRYGRSVDANGKPVALPEDADSARRRLYEQAEELKAGIVERAVALNKAPEVPAFPVLLKRAEQLAFAEEIRKAEREEYQRQVAEQSKRRRPASGSVRRSAGGASRKEEKAGDDPIAEIANHPEVIELWNRLQEENGA